MQKYSDVVLSAAGTPVAGAVITVTTYPDGAAATIYATDGGPLVASVTTNVNGRFSFYAPNGHYSILVTGTGITPVTYNDVVLFDPKDDGAAAVTYGTRSVSDKLGEFVSVKDTPFNAKGDGSDDTAAIQAAINVLPVGARLTGLGGTYTVTSLNLKSNMRLLDINLKTKAGATDLISPITIDGRTSAKSNIYLENVSVDGNRINQTNVGSPGTEDGGRHGFRLIGSCSNIYIVRCQANYCAGDGLEMFSSTSVGADDTTFVFNNIVIRDFQANYNRRHGISGDSIKGLRLENVDLKWNGLDLNAVDPLTSGGRGSRASGNLYGNGFDIEGYGLGSCVDDVRMSMVTALQNARGGGLFYDALDTRPAGFRPRQRIWISDSYFDEGQDASRSGEGLTFTSTLTSKALAALYDSVYLKNVRVDGYLLLRNVNNLQYDGEIRTSTAANYALLDHANNVSLSVAPTGSVKTIYADTSSYSLGKESVPAPANPTLAQASGVAGTLDTIVTTLLENGRDRTSRFLITARWTASAAGVPVFSITPPAGSAIVEPPRVEVVSDATALPLLASYNLGINSFRFNDPGTATLVFQITIAVKT